MKKVMLLVAILFMIVGCSNKKEEVKVEIFLNEQYLNFPEVKNIVHYLKKSPKDVKVLNEEKDRLVFCFIIDDTIDVHNETIISYISYVKLLEKDGYTMNLLDGTISSTFVLEKDTYKVSITTISDTEEWKRIQEDIDTSKMKNENLVCEISLK